MWGDAMNKDFRSKYLPLLIAVMALAAISVALNVAVGGKFLTPFNLSAIMVGATIPTFTAWGLSFIFAMNITDFSVGAIIILAATVSGTLGNNFGLPGVVLGGIVIGVLLQLVNFLLYRLTKIPSWIAGMGMAMIYESLTVVYANFRLSKGLQVIQLDESKRTLGQYPAILVILLIGAAVVYFLYNNSTIGINIRAAGSNGEIARTMGINTGKNSNLLWSYCRYILWIFRLPDGELRRACHSGNGPVQHFGHLQADRRSAACSGHAEADIDLMFAIPIATILITAIFNVLTLMGVASGTWQEVLLEQSSLHLE